MFKQLLTNKKGVIIILAILLTMIVGCLIFVALNTKRTGELDSDIKTEQSEEDTSQNDKEDKEENKESEGSKLEVLDPEEVTPENSSDVSGSWGEQSDSNTQVNTSDSSDKKEEVEDNPSNSNTEKEEDILEDDISWGNIY